MANVFSEDREIQNIGGGGSWCMIILVVVILWVLFSKDGHGHDGHYGGGYGMPYPAYGNGCGPCVQPTFKDESNYEEESHLKDKLCCMDRDIWKTDMDVWKTACETQQVEHCEAEKTRALIEANYVQDLRDKIAEQNSKIQTMKGEAFTERKFDQLAAALNCTNNNIDKMFCKTDSMIAALSCELPKRPPVWAESITPNTHHVDCDKDCGRGYNNFPRRGNCCDDGYGFGGYAV